MRYSGFCFTVLMMAPLGPTNVSFTLSPDHTIVHIVSINITSASGLSKSVTLTEVDKPVCTFAYAYNVRKTDAGLLHPNCAVEGLHTAVMFGVVGLL